MNRGTPQIISEHLLVLEFFSVLGQPENDLESDKFRCYTVPGWQSPSFSPLVLLPGESLERADLERIETFFEQHPIRNAALDPSPYFNFFASGDLYDLDAIETLCSKEGWIISKDPLSVDLLHGPMPLRLPPDFRLTVVATGEAGLHPEYEDVIRRNFKDDDEYVKAVDEAYRRTVADSYTILIGPAGRGSIGGGTVSVRNGLGFLTWGAVNADYRGRGLHRLLISACMMVARSHAVDTCALTTRNKLIRGKWNGFVELLICRKVVGPFVRGKTKAS